MAINRQYPRSTIYGTDPHHQKASIEALKQLPLERRQRIQVLRGHIGFGLHRYLPQRSTYITLLRDPVERVISHYYYIREAIAAGTDFATRPWFAEVMQMNLADYVQYGTSTDLRNGQSKFISGLLDGWDTDLTTVHDPGTMLRLAKHNIQQHFLLAGLTERFDETLLLLKHALGWTSPFYIKNNVTRKRPVRQELSQATLRVLEQCNEADLELYHYAERLFVERLREQGPSLARELRTFQTWNRAYNLSYGPVYRLQAAARSRLKKLATRLQG